MFTNFEVLELQAKQDTVLITFGLLGPFDIRNQIFGSVFAVGRDFLNVDWCFDIWNYTYAGIQY
jgi:hypothetical protein